MNEGHWWHDREIEQMTEDEDAPLFRALSSSDTLQELSPETREALAVIGKAIDEILGTSGEALLPDDGEPEKPSSGDPPRVPRFLSHL